MPKRKITIQEALTALKAQGVHVQVQSVREAVPMEPIVPVQQKPEKKAVKRTGFVKMTLRAKHTISCGGSIDESNELRGAGVVTFGPGKNILVPAEHATYLKYQDDLAVAADERMLETKQRKYIVAQKQTAYGRANAGILLADDVDLDELLGKLSPSNMIQAR